MSALHSSSSCGTPSDYQSSFRRIKPDGHARGVNARLAPWTTARSKISTEVDSEIYLGLRFVDFSNTGGGPENEGMATEKDVLFIFTGFHDPYSKGADEAQGRFAS